MLYHLIRQTLRQQCKAVVFILVSVSLLLNGCSQAYIKLSDGHVKQLKNSFVGRDFIFRTNWHNGMVVYQGKAVNNMYATMYNRTPYTEKNSQKLGKLIARGGDEAKFVDVSPLWSYTLVLKFITKQGNEGYIQILTPNLEHWGSEFYKHMTDEKTTTAWIERQLSQQTIKFIDSNATINTTLVEPPKQPQLTPVSFTEKDTNTRVSGPSISRLIVQVKPDQVRRGNVVTLVMSYEIDPANKNQINITETRNLFFNGKILPNYPKIKQDQVGEGHHTTRFLQKIPVKAALGVYTYKGEVCIPSGCNNRLVKFTILP